MNRNKNWLATLYRYPGAVFLKVRKACRVKAFVDGVTAAAIGTIVDFATAVMALLTLVALLKLKKLPEPFLVAIAAVLGIVLYSVMRP
jgi:chromate transporter